MCIRDRYKKGGRYNLVVSRFEPVGMGALAMQFEQLKKKLGDLGYFAVEHKKPLPKLPKTVGVVTSPTGAAPVSYTHLTHAGGPGAWRGI